MAIDLDPQYGIEQTVPMKAKSLSEGVSNSPEELVRAKYVLDSMATNYVEKSGPEKEADINMIKEKLSITKSENSESLFVDMPDEALSGGSASNVDYQISEDGQFAEAVVQDMEGNKIGTLPDSRIPIENFNGIDKDILKNKYSSVGDEYKKPSHTSNVRMYNGIRKDLSATADVLGINLGASIKHDRFNPEALAGVSQDVGHPVPLLLQDALDIRNVNLLSNIKTLVNNSTVSLPEVSKLSQEDGFLGDMVQHFVYEEHHGRVIQNLARASSKFSSNRFNDQNSLDRNYVNKDFGLMQVNMKSVNTRGGSPYKSARFHNDNPLANISEGMILLNQKASHLNKVVEKARLGDLDKVQAAAALTGIYNGGSLKVTSDWVKAVKGDKSAKPINLGKTTHQNVAINFSRQIRSALVFDKTVKGFDTISKNPDSTANRIWNMKVTSLGKTMTAGEWIKSFKSKRGNSVYYDVLQNEYNQDSIIEIRDLGERKKRAAGTINERPDARLDQQDLMDLKKKKDENKYTFDA